jgi:2-polyprenyl-3-methyl-5-hydroxy-6-metoxy-1,4-benzoquinol methylase
MALRWRIAQFFEILWWRNYLGNKDKAAYLRWKTDYWRDFLQKSGIALAPNSRVLDAGCGPAGIFAILSEEHETHAVDPLLGAYEAKLAHFKRADWPKVHFIQSTLEAYTSDPPFDVVFCLNAINHVIDIDACLDQLAALVRPGGTLALSIDAHNHALLKHLFRLLPGDILHPHQYDLKEYQDMVARRGFTIERSVLVKEEFVFDYWLIVGRKG